jgi:hypothetical protein
MYSLTVSLCYELQQEHIDKEKIWNYQISFIFIKPNAAQ